jgi:hypothetical protein
MPLCSTAEILDQFITSGYVCLTRNRGQNAKPSPQHPVNECACNL